MTEQYIETPEGKIFLANYPGKKEERVALVIHGWGENSKWYSDVARKLNKLGWSVVLPDLRGHGRSFGKRGYIRSWEEYTTDLERVLHSAVTGQSKEKVFLFGQSMGALVILRYLQQSSKSHSVTGAVLSSLPFHIDLKVGPFQKNMMSWLNLIYPSLSIKYKLPKDLKKHTGKVISENKKKHYGHRCFTPRWFAEFHKNIEIAGKTDFPKHIPLLLLHGAKDSMINLEQLKKTVLERGVFEEHILSYENLGHKIFQEKLNKKVYDDIQNWAEKIQ